jgi:hypothetical protein
MAVDLVQPLLEWLLPREVLQLLEHIGRQRLPAASGSFPQRSMDGVGHVSYLKHA